MNCGKSWSQRSEQFTSMIILEPSNNSPNLPVWQIFVSSTTDCVSFLSHLQYIIQCNVYDYKPIDRNWTELPLQTDLLLLICKILNIDGKILSFQILVYIGEGKDLRVVGRYNFIYDSTLSVFVGLPSS